MRRIRLRVAYDGTAYCGWQVQPEVPTIEGELNQAISRLTKEEIIVIGASRTDAGVQAQGNVAVFDTESTITAERFASELNLSDYPHNSNQPFKSFRFWNRSISDC